VEQVVRNGDPNGYPGCVNLSFSYVEVGSRAQTCLANTHNTSGRELVDGFEGRTDSQLYKCLLTSFAGGRTFLWERMYLCLSGAIVCAQSAWYVYGRC
jgi:hypothetical protein